MTMNPKERLLGAVADLQRFVIHHPDQARCPVCPRWDELQGAAMQAVTAIDAHEAELATLRAERDALRAAGEAALRTLDNVRVFVTSRERIHKPSGEEWFEGCVKALRAALEER